VIALPLWHSSTPHGSQARVIYCHWLVHKEVETVTSLPRRSPVVAPGCDRVTLDGEEARAVVAYITALQGLSEVVQMLKVSNRLFTRARETIEVNVTAISFCSLAIRLLDLEEQLTDARTYNPFDNNFNWRLLQVIRHIQQHGCELVFSAERPGESFGQPTIDLNRLVEQPWLNYTMKDKDDALRAVRDRIAAYIESDRPDDLYLLIDKEAWRHDVFNECRMIVSVIKDGLWQLHKSARKTVSGAIKCNPVLLVCVCDDGRHLIDPAEVVPRWQTIQSFIEFEDTIAARAQTIVCDLPDLATADGTIKVAAAKRSD